ncbi:hypothetical protein [Paraburkholderia sp.]|uniref:hypothetical protein n=1 Tax=Paraburkholderia sp. TaxID=1926495 RepID=UPI0039E64A08
MKVQVDPSKLAKKPRQHYNLDMDSFMPFGKHKGVDVRYLLEKMPSYLCWVLDREVDDHPNRTHQIHFSQELMTAILDKIIDLPQLEHYRYLLPDEYTAEKRAEKRAREAEQAARAAIYNEAGWGEF